MLKFIKQPISLEGKILLINGISAGYVPTFAFDHLIVLNKFTRVAFLESDYLQPSVGYLPSDIEGGALGLPGELYISGDVCILQFRSTLRFSRKTDFAKQINKLVKQHKFEGVVVVSSLPYSIKSDRQISSLQKNIYFRIKGPQSNSIKIEKCVELGYATTVEVLKDQDEEEDVIMKNAGISAALIKELESVLVLLIFNEEVEDRKTGVYFAKQLHKFIDRKQITNIQ